MKKQSNLNKFTHYCPMKITPSLNLIDLNLSQVVLVDPFEALIHQDFAFP